MHKKDLSGKVVVITGASSGIGEASALRFAQEGCRVVLAARRIERLNQLAEVIRSRGGRALPVETDITQQDKLVKLVQIALSEYGQIDILFNNAGFGRLKFFDKLDPHLDIEALLRVNLIGHIQLTREVIPHMIEHGSGHIINMVSLAGLVAMPTYSVYATSKYALRGFTEALRREVRIWGIQVSAIYPGAVRTEFDEHSQAIRKTGIHTPGIFTLTSDGVAREVVRLACQPRRMVIIPRALAPAIWFTWHFPGITDWLVEQIFVRRERL